MAFRVTLKFNTDQGGFSETWIYLGTGASVNADQTLTDCAEMYKARLALCGQGAKLVGCRISTLPPTKPAPFYNAPLRPSVIGANYIPADNTTYGAPYAANQTPDQLQTCVQIQMWAPTGQRKTLYLAGIPDDVVVTNPDGPTVLTDARWGQNYSTWQAIMQGGKWGFLAKNYAGQFAQIPIIAYSDAPVPLLGLYVTVVGGVPASFVVGQPVQITRATMTNRALQTPNGMWILSSINSNFPVAGQTSLQFAQITYLTPSTVKSPGSVQPLQRLPVPIQGMLISRQGAHKRGDFFGKYRGRRSKPARA